MNRRDFLLATTTLPLVLRCKPRAPDAEKLSSEEQKFAHLQYFVPTEARVMDAWLERLLPADTPPGTPGARDAGVLEYVDKQMLNPAFALHARNLRRAGVVLQRAAQAQGSKHFADLDARAQNELLSQMQRGQLNDSKMNVAKVFDVMLLFALEGFLGDPKHGGNKDGRVWASLGNSPACPQLTHVHGKP